MKASSALFVVAVGMGAGPVIAGPKVLTAWRHQTSDTEMQASKEQVERFNRSQEQWHIVVEALPQPSYTESITAAALGRRLPCIMDVDQPTVPNFAWSGFIRPLEGLVSIASYRDVQPGGKGYYQGKLYSVGAFDVALTLFSRYSILEKYRLRVPTITHPWSKEEFDHALKVLKASGEFTYPLDLNTVWGGEWISYGWAPLMQSFGADLINRENYVEAEGILNSPKAVAFAEWLYSLAEQGYVERHPVDNKGFISGRTAIHYTGSWSVGQYQEVFGDDLAILPVPDMGNGPVIGGGSWQWAISSSCKYPQGAAAFIDFIMQPQEIARFVDATSLVPTSEAAANLSQNFKAGSQWRIFFEFAKNYTVNRPATPAYSAISVSYEKAMRDIIDGRDPQDALDIAVDNIERTIYDNRGFGFELPQD